MSNREKNNQNRLIFWGFILALALAVFLSPGASSLPDGLERVAENLGFMQKARAPEKLLWKGAPMADYKFPGISGGGWATAISGLLGTLALVALGWGIGRLLRKK
jgi:cobalt/nickel transport protein